MQKQYELWLDESGKFQNEAELKAVNYKASLIGGILIDKEEVSKIDFDNLLGLSGGHANKIDVEDKAGVILPILEEICDKHKARQVFFENVQYEDEKTNRQLYLRMMAEGLIQLLQTLSAQEESVSLKVIIARRQDVHSAPNKREIKANEYIKALKRCIEVKKKENRVYFNGDTELVFEIKVATQTQKLMVADYACNTRLTRDTSCFEGVEARLDKLYSDAYLFTLHEIGSINYIKIALTKGNISDAIFELFTSRDNLDVKDMMQPILEQISKMGNRLLRAQVKMCIAELSAYTSKTDDYEVSEALLIRFRYEFMPILVANKLPMDRLYFAILLHLSEIYLREGDIAAASESLAETRKLFNGLGSVLEDLPTYYQLRIREAFLAIKEFDYDKADKLMQSLMVTLEGIMSFVGNDNNMKLQFSNVRSKSYADVISMRILALIHLQRDNPSLYSKLCDLSDLSMAQYTQDSSRNELEIHRRYRARIEMGAGNYETALRWLILARGYECGVVDAVNIKKFLDSVAMIREKERTQFYIMHYLLIMTRAKVSGNKLAVIMETELFKKKELLDYVEIEEHPPIKGGDNNSVDISAVQEAVTDNYYHPVEILNWKIASYLHLEKRYDDALYYYRKTTEMCARNVNYYTMYVIGIAVHSEYVACLLEMGKKELALREYDNVIAKLGTIKKEKLSDATRGFVARMEEKIILAKSGIDISITRLYEVANIMGY